jgi:organic hydroperoxide reductase OsmC/OhrA
VFATTITGLARGVLVMGTLDGRGGRPSSGRARRAGDGRHGTGETGDRRREHRGAAAVDARVVDPFPRELRDGLARGALQRVLEIGVARRVPAVLGAREEERRVLPRAVHRHPPCALGTTRAGAVAGPVGRAEEVVLGAGRPLEQRGDDGQVLGRAGVARRGQDGLRPGQGDARAHHGESLQRLQARSRVDRRAHVADLAEDRAGRVDDDARAEVTALVETRPRQHGQLDAPVDRQRATGGGRWLEEARVGHDGECTETVGTDRGGPMLDHDYAVDLRWTGARDVGTVSYRSYGRDNTLSADGKLHDIQASADRTFHGDADRWNPEEMLLGALAQCHLLSYLHVAATAGVVVVAYEDAAVGRMTQTADGGGRFTSVTLRPVVTVAADDMVDRALGLHAEAARKCFIASSVAFPVGHEPRVVVADPS